MKCRVNALLASVILVGVGCSQNLRVATTLNHEATLPAQVPQALQGIALTSWIDAEHSTMSTLFANPTAAAYARAHADSTYPPGSALSVVTWSQQEDARWFGGRIPAEPHRLEQVEIAQAADGKRSYRYRSFAGDPLQLVIDQTSTSADTHTAEILGIRAAVLP